MIHDQAVRPIPTVSIIIATYNRSQALRHAIQSVCASSFTDWELLVVGDACTDDSGDCVASFADPRMTFVNLAVRCGDQSGPNNHGVALARGRYLAFLNHDDLYRPDHLAVCVAELDRSGADLVWVACTVASPRAEGDDGELPCHFSLLGVPLATGYSPHAFYVASSWAFRRSLVDRVGPWFGSERSFVTPSQAWLFRAWRSGATLRFIRAVTVILVPSWPRPGSYARRESPDHDRIVCWLEQDPAHWAALLEAAALHEAEARLCEATDRPLRSVLRALIRPIQGLLTVLGIHPHSLQAAIRHGGRGRLIRKHRTRTGAG